MYTDLHFRRQYKILHIDVPPPQKKMAQCQKLFHNSLKLVTTKLSTLCFPKTQSSQLGVNNSFKKTHELPSGLWDTLRKANLTTHKSIHRLHPKGQTKEKAHTANPNHCHIGRLSRCSQTLHPLKNQASERKGSLRSLQFRGKGSEEGKENK